jgi:hypothetical protein
MASCCTGGLSPPAGDRVLRHLAGAGVAAVSPSQHRIEGVGRELHEDSSWGILGTGECDAGR